MAAKIEDFYYGSLKDDFFLVMPDGQIIYGIASRCDSVPEKSPVLCGSFNPFTLEQQNICRTIRDKYGGCICEISISCKDPNKGGITLEDLKKRIKQFAWKYPILITKFSDYKEKKQLFSSEPVRFVIDSWELTKLMNQGEQISGVKFLVIPDSNQDFASTQALLAKAQKILQVETV